MLRRFNQNTLLIFFMILLFLVITSYVVTSNESTLKRQMIENFTSSNNNGKIYNEKTHVSMEKINLLLSNLKSLLMTKYPTLLSVSEMKNQENPKIIWEDLSMKNNNFMWLNKPEKMGDFLLTNQNILEGTMNSANKFTIIIKTQSFQKDIQNNNNEDITVGEILANAEYDIENKKSMMTINISASIKNDFDELKKLLGNKNKTQEISKNILLLAGKIKEEISKTPNYGRKPKKNDSFLRMQATLGNIDIIIPSNKGNLIIDVNGTLLEPIRKNNVLYDEKPFFIVVIYDGSRLKVYLNSNMVIDSIVPNLIISSLIINPNKTLNFGLESIVLLDVPLNNKEIGYFKRSDIVLRSIIENSKMEKISEFNSNPNQNSICPLVVKKGNQYFVKGRSYGNDRRKAQEIYRINHPKCRIVPKILEDWYNKEDDLDETCPFMINSQFNPCKFYKCENVNWNEKDPDKARMNNKCRRRVDAYCEEHSYLDPFCYCWRTEARDLPECQKFRNQFTDPTDKGCSAADFSIEENPDFDKYIRKDKIPCWNCNISS